jgi:hypothetical protein
MIQTFSSSWDELFDTEPSAATHWLFSLPVRLEAWLGLTECDSGFGPLLFLQTSLLLSSLRARLTFADRPDSTGRVSTVEVPLVSAAQRVTPPRQMVRASSPHPELQLMVRDGSGEALTDQASLGACLNGWREVDAVFPVGADVSLEVVPRRGEGRFGTPVTLRGDLHFPRGCSLRVEFQSADRESTRGTDVPIALAERPVCFAERTARAGWEGDPYLMVELVDDSGLALGKEHFLGRCQP